MEWEMVAGESLLTDGQVMIIGSAMDDVTVRST